MRRKREDLMDQIREFAEGFYQRNLRSPYMSEIGAALGIAKSTAQKYLVEMNARGMLSYHAGEIVTEKIQKIDTSITSMGIIGSVSCGTPELEEEYVEQYVSFPTALFGKGEFFILRANGESMIGAGIDDGDLVVVRKQSEAKEGQIVVAHIENNAYKVTSDSATLTVIAFGITKQPVNITVNEGETAKFTVTATGTGLTYQWQYKTASSTTWKNCPATTDGYNAAELHPAGTTSRNGHSYRCVITDASGNKVTSDSATLTVIAFGITKQPVDITVNEGETAKFTVTATGTGLTYQWQYKTASSTTWKNCPSTTEGYNAAELHPAGTMGRNGHSYRCVITDASGNKVTSDAAILTVS